MKKHLFMMAASLLIVALTACGVVNSLIPDQAIENPFGIDGQELILSHESSGGVSAQQVIDTYSGPFDVSFADQDVDLPNGIGPNGLKETIGFGSTITVTSATAADADFPATATVTASSMSIEITDGSGDPSVSKTFDANSSISVSLTKGTCSAVVLGTACDYTLSGDHAGVIKASMTGSDFDTLFDILTEGGSPNDLSGTLSLSFQGDKAFPTDSAATVVIETTGGTLTF